MIIYLLIIARHIRLVEHVELNVLERRRLRDLPVDAAQVAPWRGWPDVDFEILDTAHEVCCVEIPRGTVC